MNLLIRIKNAMLEESKLMKERYLTMSKVSNKFIKNNKKLINYVETFIEKLVNNRYNNKDIDKIKRYLRDEKRRMLLSKTLWIVVKTILKYLILKSQQKKQ